VQPETAPLEREFGRLTITKAHQRLENDRMYLDLSMKNRFPEPVHGFRVLYRILVNADADSLEVVRKQVEADDVIAPGAEHSLTMELPRQAGQRGSFASYLHAFAVRRGNTAMPEPPHWRADAN